jgi:uncharacterized protein YggU (UPF0235/DUF167 family)
VSKAGTGLGSENFVRLAEGGVYVKLRVSPGTKSTAVKGLYGDGTIRLSAAASPVEGKANAEVERYLTQLLSLSRSEVTVAQGASNKNKLVFVSGLGLDEIRITLSALL